MSTPAIPSHGWVLHRARLYDFGTALLGGRIRALHETLLARAAIAAGERVLDVGCGPGRLTQAAAALAGPAGATLGIDASTEMIALAQKKAADAGSRARFEVAGIEALPAGDASFDVVLASLMLHHLPPELLRRGMAEVHRVLAPGGRFVARDFRAAPGLGIGHVLNVRGLRRGSEPVDQLRALAGDAGFAPVDVEPAGPGGFAILRARKPA